MTTGFNDSTAAEYLRYLVGAAGVVVWEYDWPTQSFTYVSDAVESFLGYPKDTWLEAGFWAAHVHPDERERIVDTCTRSIVEGRDHTLEYRMLRADGTYAWAREYVIVDPLLRLNGRNRGLLVDVTVQHGTLAQLEDAQHALQHKVEDLQAVFRLMRDLYFRLDSEGRYIDFIAHEQSRLFAPPERFLGKHYSEVLPPHVARMQTEALEEAARTGDFVAIEYDAELDGETAWFEARILPLQDGDTSVVVRDITPRVLRAQALEASESRLRSVVTNAPFGMHFFSLEPDGRLILADSNPAADMIFGTEHAGLIGLDIEEAFPGLTGTPIPSTYRYIAQKGGAWHTEALEYADNDYVAAFDIIAFQVSPGLIATHFVDVTERRLAEHKELEYQARLRSLTTELTDAEQSERRQLAEELHDRVSQSLAVARMHLDAACAEETPDREGVDRARALLESAIRETRALTTELAPPVLYELGLGSAMRWLCESISDVHGLEIGLNVNFAEDVLGDDRKMTLFRSTRELLMNVVKHAGAENAWVDLTNDENSVYLTVSDQGAGFDTAVLSDAASGFGLFSIKERLPGMGGSFNMRSQPGSGTQVTITLPCKRPVAD